MMSFQTRNIVNYDLNIFCYCFTNYNKKYTQIAEKSFLLFFYSNTFSKYIFTNITRFFLFVIYIVVNLIIRFVLRHKKTYMKSTKK
jgi:hypothetical protein